MKYPNFKRELELIKKGFLVVAGIDEAGRGAWAGPIYAAAVILDPKIKIKGLNDSKKLTVANREELSTEIKDKAEYYSVKYLDNKEIDQIGVGKANARVIEMAFKGLLVNPDYLLIDWAKVYRYQFNIPYETIVKGDGLVNSIAAASILAKVSRDECMNELAQKYPQYQFEIHKGYGTKLHQQMLDKYNRCEIHRRSFTPISQPKLI